MWVVVILIVCVAVLVAWRLVVMRRRAPSRPVDSGHPHLTDVDPHSANDV